MDRQRLHQLLVLMAQSIVDLSTGIFMLSVTPLNQRAGVGKLVIKPFYSMGNGGYMSDCFSICYVCLVPDIQKNSKYASHVCIIQLLSVSVFNGVQTDPLECVLHTLIHTHDPFALSQDLVFCPFE